MDVTRLALLGEHALACGRDDGTVDVWDLRQNRRLVALNAQREAVVGMVALPDGRLVTAGREGAVTVWEAQQGGQPAPTAMSSGGAITSMALVSARHGLVVTGGDDCNVRVWSCGEGRLLQTLHGHFKPVTCMAAAGDEAILSGDEEGTVKRWKQPHTK